MSNYDPANAKVYNDSTVIRYYTRLTGLTEQEQAVIDAIHPEIQGRKILDVGIGGGRTVPELTKISSDYIGVDYAQGMVDACKLKYPDMNIMTCDARSMNCFDDGQFQFVMFSFNGIDTVTHQDRMQIIKEINRVLSPGGYFVFSSHNRDYLQEDVTHEKRAGTLAKIWSFVKRLAKGVAHPTMSNPIVRQTVNRCRNKWREVKTDEYAIVNDPGHDYSLLTYYIGAKSQVKQLNDGGFTRQVTVYNKNGKMVEDCQESPWLYYCAKK